MRRTALVLSAFVLAFVFTAATQPALAQDPLKVAPTMYKLNFENDRVRVMEVTFKPGERIATHSHPEHVIYIIQPGKIKITNSAGNVTDLDAKAGETLFMPAETHWGENVGTTELKALVVELKKSPPI